MRVEKTSNKTAAAYVYKFAPNGRIRIYYTIVVGYASAFNSDYNSGYRPVGTFFEKADSIFPSPACKRWQDGRREERLSTINRRARAQMGGGNGLKSHMARQRNEQKKADEGKGGGGKAGIAARTESKIGIACAICKVQFQSVKMKTQLKEHWEAKHSKLTFGDCFPGETPPV